MRKPDPPSVFSFQEQLDFSNGYASTLNETFAFLRTRIPNYKGIRQASSVADRTGCDYYIERYKQFSIGVDLKLRGTDYRAQPPKYDDDLALETYNDIKRDTPGWTRDSSKTADYILWYWKDTGRFYLVPFPPLCYVFQIHWEKWRKTYRVETQRSHFKGRVWDSECVIVPRLVVADKISKWSNPASVNSDDIKRRKACA